MAEINEMWQVINADFIKLYEDSARITMLAQKLIDGEANYKTAQDFAREVSKCWAKALGNHIGASNIPEAMRNQAIAAEVVRNVLNMSYDDMADYTKVVQEILNKSAGISFNAVVPKQNASRTTHFIEKIVGTDGIIEENLFILGERTLENYSRSVVNDFIEENAKLHFDAGLESWISRRAPIRCCDWCESKTGTYLYGNQPSDFFQVHNDCTCVIEFHPAKKRPQRITFDTVKDGEKTKLKKNTTEF